jgi:hypothetical protein
VSAGRLLNARSPASVTLSHRPRVREVRAVQLLTARTPSSSSTQRMVRQKVHRFMLNSTNGKYPRHTSTRLTTMTNTWYGLLALGKIVPGADGWTAVL